MGRRKIEIQPITHERNRSVTFLKRKNGLFKKAYELGVLCSVDVAVIIFENKAAGHHVKLYQYCSTDIHDVVQRHSRYDGEKDTRTPSDFSTTVGIRADDGADEDEDDVEDEESQDVLPPGRALHPSSKRPRVDSGIKPSSGRVPGVGGGLDNLSMNMDMDYRRQMMAMPQPPLASHHSSSSIPISGERHRQPMRSPSHHSSNHRKPQLSPVTVPISAPSRVSPDGSHSSGTGGYSYGSPPLSASAGTPSFRPGSQSAPYSNQPFFPINTPPPQTSSFLPSFVDFPHPTSSSRTSSNQPGSALPPSQQSRYSQPGSGGAGSGNTPRSFTHSSYQQDQYPRQQTNSSQDMLASFLDSTESQRNASSSYAGSALDWPGVSSSSASSGHHSRGNSTGGPSSEPVSSSPSSGVPSATQQDSSSNWLDFLSGSNGSTAGTNTAGGGSTGPGGGGGAIRGIGDLFSLGANGAADDRKRPRGDSLGGPGRSDGRDSPHIKSEMGRPRSSSSRG